MKVAPLITVAFILCIACPGLTQAKKKPKPKFCMGKNGIKYAVGDGYVDTEEDVCIRYRCVKKKKKVFLKENKCGIDGEWTNWSSWSACTATCGNATRTKERTCSILPPITRGNQCSGPDEKIEECSLPKCSHVHRSGQNSIDSIWLEIANIKNGIMENKAAIAGHHGVLLHTDANYEYYKVPVSASSKMTSDVVLTTCIKLGMKPQCYRAYYADNACVQAPSNRPHGLHPYEMSKILCSTTPPQSCASTLNMFWYMNPDIAGWYSGSACGATKAGGFCSVGKDYTSTSDMQYFAACLKPVIPGWTIIQRQGQYGNSVDYFYKDFKDYENGFGSVDRELWIGLKELAALTKDGEWELQVDLTDWDDKKYHAKYGTFSVGPAPTYRLHVGGFKDGESTLGDSMDNHDGQAFSARDKDVSSGGSCVINYRGGWWYKNCYYANLNGLNFAEQKADSKGLVWYYGKTRGNSWGTTWKASVMKIKRVKV